MEAPARAFPALAKIAAIGSGVAVLVVGASWGYRLAAKSTVLSIRTIEVHGSRRATKESIVRLSGLEIGSNIFSMDAEAIAKNVGAHPWVKQARVLRRYPNAIAIEVVEHEPAVLVALGHVYYANAEGEIVKRYTPGEREDLPVVTGLSRDEMENDDGEAKARLRSAIDFLHELKSTLGDAAPKVAELHLDPVLGLSFVPGDDPAGSATVCVGYPPWKPRIERLAAVQGVLKERGVRASRITLGGERRPDRAACKLAPEREGFAEREAN